MKNDNDIFHHLDPVRAFERKTSTRPISQECQRQFYLEVTTEDYTTVNCVPQVDEHDREVEAQQRHVLSQTKATDSISSNV